VTRQSAVARDCRGVLDVVARSRVLRRTPIEEASPSGPTRDEQRKQPPALVHRDTQEPWPALGERSLVVEIHEPRTPHRSAPAFLGRRHAAVASRPLLLRLGALRGLGDRVALCAKRSRLRGDAHGACLDDLRAPRSPAGTLALSGRCARSAPGEVRCDSVWSLVPTCGRRRVTADPKRLMLPESERPG
jgi:hypothetical protein